MTRKVVSANNMVYSVLIVQVFVMWNSHLSNFINVGV